MIDKVCPICGRSFTAGRGNIKYCSVACRKAGRGETRKEWELRTDYKKKQRDAAERRRKEQAEAARKALEEEKAARLERWIEEEKRELQELIKRAGAGDLHALAELARHDGRELDYWRYFKQYEIKEQEEAGFYSNLEVNGISVYEDDFPERVLESIAATGHCFQRCKGLPVPIRTKEA